MMKIKQLSPHVIKCETWIGIKISMWIVLDNDGITLIDTGLKFTHKQLQKTFARQGDLQRILLTHGHPDHVGALNQILQIHEVPVYSHRDELSYLLLKMKKKINPEKFHKFPKTGNHYDLIAGLRPYHTPGHAPGHMVFYHEADDVLIAGDLFTSKKGQLRRPMPRYTANMEVALESGKKILDHLKPGLISLCHGEDIACPKFNL